MKILFLDVDGVLNSQRYFNGRKFDEHVDQLIKVGEGPNIRFWADMIDPVALALIDDLLLQKSDLFVVISSSWREVHPLGRLLQIFTLAGEPIGCPRLADRIIDRIDIGQRTIEIPEWVARFQHEITAWAVLDDLKLENLETWHVKTTWADGLKKEHIDAVLEKLR